MTLGTEYTCRFLHGRSCSIRATYTDKPHASPQFCRDHCVGCGPRAMLLNVHGVDAGADVPTDHGDPFGDLPPAYQMIKNLGRHSWAAYVHWKKTGRVLASDEHKQARDAAVRS